MCDAGPHGHAILHTDGEITTEVGGFYDHDTTAKVVAWFNAGGLTMPDLSDLPPLETGNP